MKNWGETEGKKLSHVQQSWFSDENKEKVEGLSPWLPENLGSIWLSLHVADMSGVCPLFCLLLSSRPHKGEPCGHVCAMSTRSSLAMVNKASDGPQSSPNWADPSLFPGETCLTPHYLKAFFKIHQLFIEHHFQGLCSIMYRVNRYSSALE